MTGHRILDRVTIAASGGVADVRLARPDKMNAIDGAMFRALAEAIAMLKAMPGLRAVVLSGEGESFCAGLDKAAFAAMLEGRLEAVIGTDLLARSHGSANLPQHAAAGWRELAVPVIVAVTGTAFGGGLQIALGGDLRLAAPGARFSAMEIRWGLIPDMGGMWLMQRLLRDDVMRELIYTGRIVEASEAREIGLVTRLCDDPRGEALALAQEIAALSPTAVRSAKRLANLPQADDFGAMLQAESREQASLVGSRDQREAVRANLERRPARFED